MTRIAVIGAGITGVTTAYALRKQGYDVTVLERHRYPAMETSFANGGQLSACNAEVWNNMATVIKGLKWMTRRNAPLLFNPMPSWHKYSWIYEFLKAIPDYRANTVETVRLAIAARDNLYQWAADEAIDFNVEKRGILHVYHSRHGYESGLKVSELLKQGGLERTAVGNDEIHAIEPALQGTYYGGFFTPSDATGDIHKYTRGLAAACEHHGVQFMQDIEVHDIGRDGAGFRIAASSVAPGGAGDAHTLQADAVVICAGTGSRRLAAMLGDRVNIYPVKGYSITVNMDDEASQAAAPWVSLLDEEAKIVTSRLGADRLRVAGTAEYNGYNKDVRADRVQPLIDWTRRQFAPVDTARVVPWAGLRPMMPNMMPQVRPGRQPGVFYNTGHGHLGWTLSAMTAQLVTDLVQGSIRVS